MTMVFLALEETERLTWDLFLEKKSDLLKNAMNCSGDDFFCVSLSIEHGRFVKDLVDESTC